MANRFIPYVPKPIDEKHSSKPPCKSLPKQTSTVDSSQQIERNSAPIRAPAMDGDLPIQKVNRYNGIVTTEFLKENWKSSNNSDEDEDDMYFFTVQELIAGRGVSGRHAPKAVDKPALGDEHSISPNLGDSQDNPILVAEDEVNDSDSEADNDNFYQDGIKPNTNYLHSQQISLGTTISSSSIRDSDGDSDSSNDSDSDSDNEVENRPTPKKRKIDDIEAQTVRGDLLAVNNPIVEGSDCQDLYDGRDPYGEFIDGKLKEDSDATSALQSQKNDRSHSPHMTPAPTAPAVPAATPPQEPVVAKDSQSVTLAATAIMKSTLGDLGIPRQVVEVANDKQEWEICGIIEHEDVDGVWNYWVQWTPTLVPESEMGKARGLVARYKARLLAQQKQKCGKGLRMPLPSKVDKQAAAGVHATGQTQEKKRCGRPCEQISTGVCATSQTQKKRRHGRPCKRA